MYTFSVRIPLCEEQFFENEQELIAYFCDEIQDFEECLNTMDELYECIDDAKSNALGMSRFHDLAKIYYLPKARY